MAKYLLLLVMFLVSLSANSEQNDGHYLFKQCSQLGVEPYPSGYCYGLIMGAIKMHALNVEQTSSKPWFCIKDTTTNKDIVNTVTDFLSTNKDELEFSDISSITLALTDAYPCDNDK